MSYLFVSILRHLPVLARTALLLALAFAPRLAWAQAPEWKELRTAHFAILYPEGTEAEARQYAQFVDAVYDEVSAVFSYRTPPPVVLRIYPTMDLYYRVNPLAAQMPGVVAHAHTGRREISIALPQTAGQPDDQIVNNVRHELAHIIAADLSGGKLTTAFQEGIAQYVEHPSAELDVKMQLMRQIIAEGRLLTWRELNRPGAAYADPRVSYPESYTIAAFLIERDGFATFRDFIELTKTSTGYRGALERAYGESADQLEREWREQLDTFVAGAYRDRALGAFDLSEAEALVARGEYGAAVGELEAALTVLGDSEPAVAERAQELLAIARAGQQVQELAAGARGALERGDYAAAEQLAAQGRQLLETIDQPTQLEVMQEYSALAARGLAAQNEMFLARAELQTLRVGDARFRLAEAYTTFTRLGDEHNAALARASLLRIQRTEMMVGAGLLLLAGLLLAWNVSRRRAEREQMLPFG